MWKYYRIRYQKPVLIGCCIVLALALLVTGAVLWINAASEKQELAEGIVWNDYPRTPFPCRINNISQEVDIGHDMALGDADLQNAVKRKADTLPLNTEEAITAYAWDITPALRRYGYIPEDFGPAKASHYTNDVWRLSFIENATFDSIPPHQRWGEIISVYLSEIDGHIIFIFHED